MDGLCSSDNEAADKAKDLQVPPSVVVTPSQPHTCCPTCTQIPLTTLFDFTRSDNSLDFYWKGAIKNLDAEAEACELAFVQQEWLQMSGILLLIIINSTLFRTFRHHFLFLHDILLHIYIEFTSHIHYLTKSCTNQYHVCLSVLCKFVDHCGKVQGAWPQFHVAPLTGQSVH